MRISTEAKVGMMITFSFTVFIVMVAVLAKFNVSRSGYNIKLYYSFLNDLRVGAAAKIGGGIKIGEVKDISQSGDKTIITLWIDNKYKLTKSTTFAIFTTGLIGEKYINVIVPSIQTNEGYLKDGDVKYGIDPASFDKMMQTFESFMTDKSGGEILADIFQNSSRFVDNLNSIAEENRSDIRSSVTTTRVMVYDLQAQTKIMMEELNKLAKNSAEISEVNKEDIKITLRNLSETTDNLNKIIYRLENGDGTLGKLITDDEIYNNLRDASIYARDLFEMLKKDPNKLFFSEPQ
ncbi:MAG: MCE family protein [Spirochaetes bacterium]|nr:MCE family protein [Spirochaetota bacterium]